MSEMTVGEVAEYAGLTIRTLHHWDEIALLEPSRRSAAGYRLYTEPDLERLLEILLLRRLGLALPEIKKALGGGKRLDQTLETHIERLRERIAQEQLLLRRLEVIAGRLASSGHLSIPEIKSTMETLTMHEKYFTPEQLDTLKARAEAVGPDIIKAAEAEWPQLIARVRAALESGADPASPEVAEIAYRWRELTQAFTGGDPGLAASVAKQYREEPKLQQKTGLDATLFEYMGRAMAAL